jgi:hypothetical protein
MTVALMAIGGPLWAALASEKTFTITKIWLMANRTRRGSWNYEQFKCLGLSWPPAKNWQKTVTGNQITAENAERFVSLAGEVAKKRN